MLWLARLGELFIILPLCLICIFNPDLLARSGVRLTDSKKKSSRRPALFLLIFLSIQAGIEILVHFLNQLHHSS
jgi:hypothetical protein